MSSSISFEDKLLANGTAKCPKCKKGNLTPKFPNHKRIFDYECEECGYSFHFEPMVIVE